MTTRTYAHGLRTDSVALGTGSGAALTTGTGNTLLGPQAGAALTSGSRNVILGGYTGADQPTDSGHVVLSDGDGTVRCRFDATGAIQLPLGVSAPTPREGCVTLSFDTAKQAVVATVLRNGTTHTSRTANPAVINEMVSGEYLRINDANLVSTGLGTTGATSLVHASTRLGVRSLTAAGALTIDGSSSADTVRLSVPALAAAGTDSDGVSLVHGTGATVRRLKVGNGLILTPAPSGNALELSSEFSTDAVTLANRGSGTSLVAAGTGPNLAVRSLSVGTGLSVSLASDTVVLTNTQPATKAVIDPLRVTAGDSDRLGGKEPTEYQLVAQNTLLSTGGGTSLVHASTRLGVRSLTAAGALTIDGSSSADTVRLSVPFLTAAGTISDGLSLLYGTGAAVAVRRLQVGNGLILTEVAEGNALRLVSEFSTNAVTLTSQGTGTSLVTGGTGPNLSVRSIRSSGTGLSVDVGADGGLVLTPGTLVSTGGTQSLAGSSAQSVKGLTPGRHVFMQGTSEAVTVASKAPVIVAVGPSDIVATHGLLTVVPAGRSFTLSGDNWFPWTTLRLPAVRFGSISVANATGACMVAVHGLPPEANTMGYELHLTMATPDGVSPVGFQVTLTTPRADWSPSVWSGSFSTGAGLHTVAVTLTTEGTNAVSKTDVMDAAGTKFPSLPGPAMMPSPAVVSLSLENMAILNHDVDILGIRFVLRP